MLFHSTRGNEKVTASFAILHGLANDGGLYVPETIPTIDIKDYFNKTYAEIATQILGLFYSDFLESELFDICKKVYCTTNFSLDEITGIQTISENEAYLELFYGQTLAFKDQALSLFPYLLTLSKAKQKQTKDILILTATSGDTGKAAMEAIKDLPNIKIAVLYPAAGVSTMQKAQMQKQLGNNVFPIAINGNFDDAQTAVKQIFNSPVMQEFANSNNYLLSSANSINIARLLPQIVYYIDGYARLVTTNKITSGEKINVTVPTGNFGNILSLIMAKKMGLPIAKIICATNENNVLADFIQTGKYDIRSRDFLVTPSPSMDILIASNLERFLYLLLEDTAQVGIYMEQLSNQHFFQLSDNETILMQEYITGYYTTNTDTITHIKAVFDKYQYLIDPHTSVASFATARYKENHPHDKNYFVNISTASPYKFIDCYRSIFAIDEADDYLAAEMISKYTGTSIPQKINELKTLPIRFPQQIEITAIEATIKQLMKLGVLE